MGFFGNNARRYALDMRRLKLPKARKVPKYSPTNEEVRHLYTMADCSRDRLIVALMYHNGLSPIDMSCLNVGDLPLSEWAYYEKSRSKTGEIFRAVVTPDIAYELKIYLKIRGNPSKGKPLFVGRQGPLDNQAISAILSELIEKSSLGGNNGFKPTSLRDALEDGLVSANINHKLKETIMGHVSDIEHEYGGQNKLIVNVVEAMKKTYPLLTLNGLTRISTQQGVSRAEFEAVKTESQVQLSQKDKEIQGLRQNFEELKNYTMTLSQAMLDANLLKKGLPLVDTKPITETKHDEETQKKSYQKAKKPKPSPR
jgi:hypothetical protein